MYDSVKVEGSVYNMLEWFKKIFTNRKQKLPKFIDDSLKSMSKARAVYEITSEHMQKVKQGKEEYPAHARKNKNVVEIWGFTRIEAFIPFLMSPQSNITILGDFSKQKEILDVWFNKKPHLEFPHRVTDNEIEETIKAIFNVYINISKIVDKVGADEIDSEGKIFDSFDNTIKKLKELWDVTDSLKQPPLIFDVLFEDITKKTKIIALCTALGPDYENMYETLTKIAVKSLEDEGVSKKEIEQAILSSKQKFTKLMAQTNPDK